jgi:cell division septum initiation protein DivIVA
MPPTLQAAGRVLSQRNTDRLKNLFREVGSILVDAKVTGIDDLRGFLGEIEKVEEQIEERIEELEGAEVVAGKVGDEIKSSSWQVSVFSALDTFRMRFTNLFRMTEEQIDRYYGTEKDRSAIAQEMLNDFNDFLEKQIDDFPGYNQSNEEMHPPLPSLMYDPMYASAATDDSPRNSVVEEVVQAEGQQEELELEFKCEVHEIEAAATVARSPRATANCLPIEGVLFIIDEPSECAPSKGSELPLYVPRHVAEVAAEAINASGGLPLDADDSLSCHANNHIVGIMTSARIEDNKFLVKGHLFPWSQGEKVQLIAANQEILGMSMNAHAVTCPAIIGGKRVSSIQVLDILGANILYADRATYQKTQARIAASKEKEQVEEDTSLPQEPDLVAASHSIQEPTMDPEEIKKYFDQMNGTLSNLAEDNRRAVEGQNELRSQVAVLAQAVDEIQAERKAIQAQRQASQTEAERKQERDSLVQAMGEVIKSDRETLKAEILNAINPSRQPARITRNLVDLVAASGDSENKGQAMTGEQVRYIQAQGELKAYRTSGTVGIQRTKLVEEIASIEGRVPGIKDWFIACGAAS